MKKLLYLSLITLSGCHSLALLGSDAAPGRFPDDALLMGSEAPADAQRQSAAKKEAEICEFLKEAVLKEKDKLARPGERSLEELAKDIAKKELERDLKGIYSAERAREQGAFIAARDSVAHQHNHSPERAEREGEYLAAREKAKRKNDTFLNKLPNAFEDGALSAISSLVQQAGVVLGVSIYRQAKKALATDTTSPEERAMLEKEAQWTADAQRLERQMQHDATYMAFVKTILEADATRKAMAQYEEEHKKFLQKQAEEQAKAEAVKVAIAEQQGSIPSALVA